MSEPYVDYPRLEEHKQLGQLGRRRAIAARAWAWASLFAFVTLGTHVIFSEMRFHELANSSKSATYDENLEYEALDFVVPVEGVILYLATTALTLAAINTAPKRLGSSSWRPILRALAIIPGLNCVADYIIIRRVTHFVRDSAAKALSPTACRKPEIDRQEGSSI